MSFSGIFLLFSKLTLVSIEQIAVLVVFSEKKNVIFKSMLRFAVIGLKDIDVTFS